MISQLTSVKNMEILESINDKLYKFGICHGDLNSFNIIYNEENKQMTLLDFEYTCYNPIGYDIAYVIMSRAHSFGENGMKFDPERWISDPLFKKILKEYLKHLEGDDENGDDFFDNIIECVQKCFLMINMFWSIWSTFKIREFEAGFGWESCVESRIVTNDFLLKKYFDH